MTGVEVDFIIGTQKSIAIEVESTASVHGDHLKGLRQFKQEFPEAQRLIVVSLDPRRRILEDGIDVWPFYSPSLHQLP